MRLSPEEKRLIEDLRKKKKAEADANTPKMMAYAKENIHSINTNLLKELKDGMYGWYLSKSDIESLNEEMFSMEVPAGTEFVCYLESGEESWYDTVYGIEGMDAEWARKYLRDIQPYKKAK